MLVPVDWLGEYVELPRDLTTDELVAALVRVGHEVEEVTASGEGISGVLVGEVLEVELLEGFRKPIRFCTVRTTADETPRGIVCGAENVVAGARVPVALPGATLPGGFTISRRKTYGRVSDGMICSASELQIGDDHSGIMILPADAPLGTELVDYLGLPSMVLDIAVTPDRGYCLSMRGMARETAAALGLTFTDPAGLEVPAPGPEEPWPVRVEDPEGCDRYVARVLEDLDPATPSPLWLARSVALAGMRSISLAVDITNYVMLGLGQPLHAFDADRLQGAIVVRRARAGERLVTLDGVDRALDPDDLVIADDSGPVALAGVMGGEATEVSDSTRRVVLESAHFDPYVVTRTARRHGLPSEASRRFERGVDPLLCDAAAQLAVDLLTRLSGARAVAGVTDVGTPRLPAAVRVHAGLPSRVLGVQYAEHTVRERWEQVGCSVAPLGADVVAVTPPSWRPDLTDPFDLVEEVARLEGYDAIPATLPTVPTGRGGLTERQRRTRAVGQTLAEAGWVEVLPYPFMAADALDALWLPDDDPRRHALPLANPLSEEIALVRTTLLPGLLSTLLRNVGRGVTDVALFELGQVARASGPQPSAPRPDVRDRPTAEEMAALEAALPEQPLMVGCVLAGDRTPAGWWGSGRPGDWADVVAAARDVARAVRVHVDVTAAELAPWHPGRCAALAVEGRVVGHAGELHPRVVAALELPRRTCAMELDLGALLDVAPFHVPAPQISSYPPARMDVAVVVADGTSAVDVASALREGAGDLLESLDLFDVYQGSQLSAGERSLAYTLTMRAPDRTLTNEEAVAARDAAVASAARLTGARLRD